jgi:macrolide transport system ATP-binding/permease protein
MTREFVTRGSQEGYALEISQVSHDYGVGESRVSILKNVSLNVRRGEFVAIQGPSGSGKSTLLYLLGCLMNVQKGSVRIFGKNLQGYTPEERALLRNKHIGFIFQQFHLLPKTSVLKNILLPTQYLPLGGSPSQEELKKRAIFLATEFGLGERLQFTSQQLSGGQQQRVAIARALINDPEIILADEPTGNLDSMTAMQIMRLLRDLNIKHGKTVVVITHDNEIAAQCDRTILVKDGVVVGQEKDSVVDLQAIESKKSRGPSIKDWISNLWSPTEIVRSLPSALENLKRNKVRTALTMIGVSIGIAAVLSMMTLGEFIRQKVLAGYAELGVNTLLFYGYSNWEQKATDQTPLVFKYFDWERDIEPLKNIFPEIEMFSPVMVGWESTASFGGQSLQTDVRIVGASEEAIPIAQRVLLKGRNLSKVDVRNKNGVCLIGFEIHQRLFSNVQALGQVIRVTQGQSSFGCRVIGVLESSTSNKEWLKPNMQIIVPFTFFQSISNDWWAAQIQELMIQVKPETDIERTGKGIRAFFEQKYGVSGRFRVDSDSVLLNQMKRFLALFTTLLAAIAFVTLTVGGMGITNMMLVSVSDRYREIGLRKALGATDRSIRIQFLTEATLVCVGAGFFGLIIGFAGYHAAIWSTTKFVSTLSFEWVVNPAAIAISIVSILAVGLLSGFFPALKAEKLQVIEALRSD